MAKGQQRGVGRESFWREVLARFDPSGLSVRGFCEREGLSEPSFYAWRRVIRDHDAQQRQPAFVPVVVSAASDLGPSQDGIVIELRVPAPAPGGGGGRVLTLRLPPTLPLAQVAELVHAIAADPGRATTAEARP